MSVVPPTENRIPVTQQLTGGKDVSFSFDSRASGSQSEFGISQRVDGNHVFASSSLIASGGLASSAALQMAALNAALEHQQQQHKVPSQEVMLATPPNSKTSPPHTPLPLPTQQSQGQSKKTAKRAAAAAAAAAAASATTGTIASGLPESAPSTAPATPPVAAVEPPKAKNANVRRNVYISGVPPTYRSEDFRQLCQQFGRVEAAKLCVDNRNAPTKAYGFALFYSEESAAGCIRGLNGSFLQGRCLQARLADSHATPQPLGDAGAAINTTLPLPSVQRERRDARPRRGDGGRRDSQGGSHSPLPNPGLPGGNASATMNASGVPVGMPFNPMMMPSMTGSAAMPMPMAQFYPFMAAAAASGSGVYPQQMGTGGVGAATVTPGASPVEAHIGATASPSSAYFTVTPGSCSPYTDRGFGAIGTPVPAPVTPNGSPRNGPTGLTAPAAPNSVAALSPVFMALSAPLLSPNSTDSASSLVSPTATTLVNHGSHANTNNTTALPQAMSSPYTMPFPNFTAIMSPPGTGNAQASLTSHQQLHGMAAAGVSGSSSGAPGDWAAAAHAAAAAAAAPGTAPAIMYYPLPNGGFGAFAAPMSHGAGSPFGSPPAPSMASAGAARVAAGGAGAGTMPLMYYPMTSMPGAGAAAAGMPTMASMAPFMQMGVTSPVQGAQAGPGIGSGADVFPGLTPNMMMVDSDMGLQLHMLR